MERGQEVMFAKEVAEMWGTTRQAVTDAIKHGRLKALPRPGDRGPHRILRKDAEEWNPRPARPPRKPRQPKE